MYAHTLGLLATSAVASAILLPPEVSTSASNINSELAALGVVDPETQIIEVPSGKCVNRDGDCSIVLNFTTAAPRKHLSINGAVYYASDASEDTQPMAAGVKVAQLPAEVSLAAYAQHPDTIPSQDLLLTASSFMSSTTPVRGENGETVMNMDFQIYSLEKQAVNVPSVNLKVLQSPDGELMILSINVAEPSKDDPQDKICADWPMICQLRDYINGKAHAMKEGLRKTCGGKKGKFGPGKPKHPHHKGADRPQPPMPEIPERPDFPDFPDFPKHPGHPKMPDFPDFPKMPDMPDFPDMPEMPKMPVPDEEDDGLHEPHYHHRHGPPRGPHGPHGPHRHHPHGDWFAPSQILFMIVGAICLLVATWVLGYVIGTVVGYSIVAVWLLFRKMRGSKKYQQVPSDEEDALIPEEDKDEIVVAEIPLDDPPAYDEKEVVA